MGLSTMHSVILMLLLMFVFDNVHGDESGQTARDVDNGKFMSSPQSEGKLASFFMLRTKDNMCDLQYCPGGCSSPCWCSSRNTCEGNRK
nr:conotoxin precursor Rimp02 [Conus judaeus]